MSIILFLGRNIKEYKRKSKELINQAINQGSILCELCLAPMTRHSTYTRKIKETGQRIPITMVWCRKCKKWHALLPDFLLPNKHYSGNEIESVFLDSTTKPTVQAKLIATKASECTIRRWIRQISERIKQAVAKLKYLFGRDGQAVSEVAIDAGLPYEELEQVLDMAPYPLKCSGNKLGLANIWLGTDSVPAYI